ncbi:MAG TPA: VWA domain-containing protein [Gemmatimonadota bacterium]|nr:VWA domain-containing protein [Gemmatimonadota bacterium]
MIPFLDPGFGMWAFASPAWLFLLLGLPAFWIWASHRRRRRRALVLPALATARDLPRTWRERLRGMPEALRVLAFACGVLALARPQELAAGRPITTSGVDIVLALDASGSMKAEDFQPRNRLEVAKEAAIEFVQDRASDRIGIVTFAGQAVTQAPLTLDHEALTGAVRRVEIGGLAEGTAIGTALATAVNRLRASEARSRVVILLTDGVNNAGPIDPLTAAETARALGVRVYTIGVGTTGEAPYLLEDPRFGRRYVRVVVRIDEEILERIASRTGGRYFRATDPQALDRVYAEIDRLERSPLTGRRPVVRFDRYLWFLLPALGFIVMEGVLRGTLFRRLP